MLSFSTLWRASRNGASIALFVVRTVAQAAPCGLFGSCAARHDKTWLVAKSGGFCNSGWCLHIWVVFAYSGGCDVWVTHGRVTYSYDVIEVLIVCMGESRSCHLMV